MRRPLIASDLEINPDDGSVLVRPGAELLPDESNVVSLAVSNTAAQSPAITAAQVEIVSNVDCFIVFGANPTATTASRLFPAGKESPVPFVSGQKISVLQVSGGGICTITPLVPRS